MIFDGIPIYSCQFTPKFDNDGKKKLFQWVPGYNFVLVHPDHWDEFRTLLESVGKRTASDGDPAVDSETLRPK